MIKTRFAPSPTGFLHVGGLRTALFSYLLAKSQKGIFLLRVEDTDQGRFVEGAIENMVRSLAWAGITPDEGVDLDQDGKIIQKGTLGPYIQSERLSLYQSQVEILLENGHAYHCFCSKERLDEIRKVQELNKKGTGYDGFCRSIPLEEAKQRKQNGEVSVVRMKMPREGVTVCEDEIRGRVEFQNALVDDQVLLKSDGFPTYHLAVVVDDHFMEVTHVIRGEEWLSSTPKHIMLYELFGWKPPVFAHLPLLINAERQKLSKRHGDVAVEDFQSRGFLPEAMVNFVAFLGWNPGDEQEIFSISELFHIFSLSRASKSAAVFNEDKLVWYNKEYIKRLTPEETLSRASSFFEKEHISLSVLDRQTVVSMVALEKERIDTLADLPQAIAFLLSDDLSYEASLLIWKKDTKEGSLEKLGLLKAYLESLSEESWTKDVLEKQVGDWIAKSGFSVGDILWPFRVALSGQKNSPGPYEIAGVLGKNKSLERITKGIEALSKV